MIFVVIRPKTKDIVKQNRARWLSCIRVEYGEYSQAPIAPVYMTIGAHSVKTGAIGRPCFRRALTTL